MTSSDASKVTCADEEWCSANRGNAVVHRARTEAAGFEVGTGTVAKAVRSKGEPEKASTRSQSSVAETEATASSKEATAAVEAEKASADSEEAVESINAKALRLHRCRCEIDGRASRSRHQKRSDEPKDRSEPEERPTTEATQAERVDPHPTCAQCRYPVSDNPTWCRDCGEILHWQCAAAGGLCLECCEERNLLHLRNSSEAEESVYPQEDAAICCTCHRDFFVEEIPMIEYCSRPGCGHAMCANWCVPVRTGSGALCGHCLQPRREAESTEVQHLHEMSRSEMRDAEMPSMNGPRYAEMSRSERRRAKRKAADGNHSSRSEGTTGRKVAAKYPKVSNTSRGVPEVERRHATGTATGAGGERTMRSGPQNNADEAKTAEGGLEVEIPAEARWATHSREKQTTDKRITTASSGPPRWPCHFCGRAASPDGTCDFCERRALLLRDNNVPGVLLCMQSATGHGGE